MNETKQETQHTPGPTPEPWEIIPGANEGWPLGKNPIIRQDLTSGHYVAEIRANDGDDPQTVAANARLIAAAPALLEALVLAENRLAIFAGIGEGGTVKAHEQAKAQAAMDQARAALARARGEAAAS